jgi:hypothetical protein
LGAVSRRVAQWCQHHRHDSVEDHAAALNAKLRGHYQYYGRPTNFRSLRQFYWLVRRLWHRWLNRLTRGKTLPGATSCSCWTSIRCLVRGSVMPGPERGVRVRNRVRQSPTLGSVRGECRRYAMVNLHAHAAGNDGKSQGTPIASCNRLYSYSSARSLAGPQSPAPLPRGRAVRAGVMRN